MGFRAFVVSCWLSAVTHGAGGGNAWGPLDNLFGPDKRVPVTSSEFPWSAVGKLSTGCTATLVGANLVVTAAHCVVDTQTRKLRSDLTYFYPNLVEGKARASASIEQAWWGTDKPDSERTLDWAILRLKQDLGRSYGWMGVEADQGVRTVTLVGYSGDFRRGETAGAHLGCSVLDRMAGGLWLHDCHNSRGASGGPLFGMRGQEPYLFAINVAEYRDGGETSLRLPFYERRHSNIALSAGAFLSKLKELLK